MADTPNGKLLWWLLSTLATIVLAGGAGWVGAVQSQVNGVAAIQAQRGERMASLEQRAAFLEATVLQINAKLDQLLAERRGGR